MIRRTFLSLLALAPFVRWTTKPDGSWQAAYQLWSDSLPRTWYVTPETIRTITKRVRSGDTVVLGPGVYPIPIGFFAALFNGKTNLTVKGA